MTFTVTVTERGEPSETMTFSSAEITIGRVRGNDIVLRKGSVSKRHAKILVKDGKFVVIDLKSTNGTIVNGRKITAPQVVRPTDKLVVGDYVLEVAPSEEEQVPVVSAAATASGPLPPVPPGAPLRRPPPQPPQPPQPPEPRPAPAHADVPSPVPASGSGPRLAPQGDSRNSLEDSGEFVPAQGESVTLQTAGKTHTTLAMRVPSALFRDSSSNAGREGAPLRLPPGVFAEGFAAAHRAALAAVLDAIPAEDLPSAYPPSRTDRTRIERAIRLALPTTEGFVDNEDLVAVLVQEFAGLGPIEFYLDNPDITEVHVNAHDAVFTRKDGRLSAAPLTFGARDTLMAAARRIVIGADIRDPLGGPVRLPDGTRLELVMPPAASGGPVILVNKPGRSTPSTQEMIDRGTMSPAIASALQIAAAHGGSILVSSVHREDATGFVNAILASIGDEPRIVAVETVPSLHLTAQSTVRLENVPGTEPSTLQRAVALEPQILVVDPFGGDMVVDWLVDAASAACGFVATFGARNASDAMSRLVLMALQGRAADVDSVRRQIANSLDLLVQLRRVDGRVVVGEVMELSGVDAGSLQAQTVFQSKVGPSGLEFSATGHVPRLFSELSAAGVAFDTSVFNT